MANGFKQLETVATTTPESAEARLTSSLSYDSHPCCESFPCASRGVAAGTVRAWSTDALAISGPSLQGRQVSGSSNNCRVIPARPFAALAA